MANLYNYSTHTKAENELHDAVLAEQYNGGGIIPTSVPDRNLLGTSSTNDTSNLSEGIKIDGAAPPEFSSAPFSQFESNQLAPGSGAEIGNGVPAASTTSLDSAMSFSDANAIQQAINTSNNTASFLNPASPITDSDLQDPSKVFNNAFATQGNPTKLSVNPSNLINLSGADQFDRIKLRFMPGHPYASYPLGSILEPLAETNGMVWLFKPTVSVANSVDYETMNLTHAIQEIHSFSSNKAVTISISGLFVNNTIDDALYTMAAIHFLRTASKMSFGTAGTISETGLPSGIPIGSPPPVLLLSGYGRCMFNDIPVIITGCPLELSSDVNYIEIPYGPAQGTKLPVSLTLSVTLTVQQSPQNMRSFSLDKYGMNSIKGWW